MAPIYISYTKNCQVPKEGHLGQFPANFCVKMTGTSGVLRIMRTVSKVFLSEATGETLVTRTCVLEDMNSQCGHFKFQVILFLTLKVGYLTSGYVHFTELKHWHCRNVDILDIPALHTQLHRERLKLFFDRLFKVSNFRLSK